MTPSEHEAARLFADGYGITSRKYRIASRCPPAMAKGMDRQAVDFYRRVKSNEKIIVSAAVMSALLKLQGRGMA